MKGFELQRKQTVLKFESTNLTVVGMYCRGEVSFGVPMGTQRVAHITWRHPINGGRRTISYVVGHSGIFDIKEEHIVTSTTPYPHLERILGVKYEITNRFAGFSDEIRAVTAANLMLYLKWDKAPLDLEYHETAIEIVKRVKPVAIVEQGDVEIKEAGKQHYHPDCLYDLSVDFSSWCVSCRSMTGLYIPWTRCSYCYGNGNHKSFSFVCRVEAQSAKRTIERLRKARAAQGKRTDVLRLGVKMDAGHRIYREQLLTMLELAIRTGLRPVLPSKFLEFDADVAILIKQAGGIIMPSLGNDQMEPGAVHWGRSQDARIEDGILYQEAGCCVAPFALADPSQPQGGPHFSTALKKAGEKFENVQLGAIRLCNKRLANTILGDWDEIVKGQNARYERDSRSRRIPLRYDSSIKNLIRDNNGKFRMCGHNSVVAYCGGCHIGQGKVLILGVPKSRRKRPVRLGGNEKVGKRVAVVKGKGGAR